MGWRRGQAEPYESAGRAANQPEEYQRRQPEQTALHRVVRENLEDFLSSSREENGAPLPRFIERAFRAYLACGIASRGFTRLVCQRCGHEAILAFSCKTRQLCPSCAARHMEDGAVHLVDDVLPSTIPYRHIVVSLPFEVRGLLAFRPPLLNAALRLINDSVLRWQEERARFVPAPRVGGVSVLQRAGGSLNLNPHVHLLLADGAFTEEPDGSLHFHPTKPPTLEDVARLAKTIDKRLTGMLRRRGFIRQEDDSPPLDKPEPIRSCIQLALTTGHREREGGALLVAPDELEPPSEEPRALCATQAGVNIHAGVVVPANERPALTRLVRYLLRPPFSLLRFSLREDGAVVYRLRQADRRGRTVLVLSPMELLARLAAILPAPRFALRREIGVFAAGSPIRRKVIPTPPPPGVCHLSAAKQPARQAALTLGDGPRPQTSSPKTSPSVPAPIEQDRQPSSEPFSTRLPWAELLRRTWNIDSLRCPRCEGRMAPVEVITEPAEAECYLRQAGLAARAPPTALARGPPAAKS